MLLQRIWVVDIGTNFTSAKVKLNKSLLNINYNSSIFGGTIYAATDAFYPVLFHQLFTHAGYHVIVWLKSAQVHYIKPGRSALHFEIKLDQQQIAEAKHILDTEGKFIRSYLTELYNTNGELCASVSSEVYVRNLNFTTHEH
ncbi:DUF4442 domain-containing protein [Mucilaginibacter koreensis]